MAAGPSSRWQPDYLAGDDVQGLVPADGLVAGDAAVLGVAPAGPGGAGGPAGVEVHPLERGEDALGRVDGATGGRRCRATGWCGAGA